MSRLTKKQDAFGAAIYDCFHGQRTYEIVERDDGFFGLSAGPLTYFKEYADWPEHQREAISLARGRVLDVGCGAGRVALYLQCRGLDVTGVDNSPLAIAVCKARGVKKARVISVTQLSRRLGVFDTIVMYGSNFGLFGGFRRARWLLRRFHGMTGLAGRIIVESRDPYGPGKLPRCHLEYHRFNCRRGRMGSQLRIRIRYRRYATPWFDYLLASKQEMARIVRGTGWRITRFFDSQGSHYIAVLEKEPRTPNKQARHRGRRQ
jgi:SAM-dependent methyltransferase